MAVTLPPDENGPGWSVFFEPVSAVHVDAAPSVCSGQNSTMARTPIHPGEVLSEALEALGVSPIELSRQIRVPANCISRIINGKRAILGDTALHLAHWFGSRPQFWMNLQARCDVRLPEQQAGTEIRRLPTKPGQPEAEHRRPG